MTPSRKTLLIKILDLWNVGGRSASDIAREVGLGSRNTVMGLLHRAKASGIYVAAKNSASVPRKKREKRERTVMVRSKPPATPVRLSTAAPPTAVTPPLRLSILDLQTTSCRFIADDGTFCGHTTTRISYCPDHATIVYQPRGEEHDAPGR